MVPSIGIHKYYKQRSGIGIIYNIIMISILRIVYELLSTISNIIDLPFRWRTDRVKIIAWDSCCEIVRIVVAVYLHSYYLPTCVTQIPCRSHNIGTPIIIIIITVQIVIIFTGTGTYKIFKYHNTHECRIIIK